MRFINFLNNSNNKFFINKKGISGIIATVLMILITITSVFIIASVILPFIRDNLKNQNTISCFEIGNELKLIYEKSCYDDTISPGKTEVRVIRGGVELEGIYLLLENEDGTVDREIITDVPDKGGGEKTYPFGKVYKKASVGAIVPENDLCGVSDEIILRKCPTP